MTTIAGAARAVEVAVEGAAAVVAAVATVGEAAGMAAASAPVTEHHCFDELPVRIHFLDSSLVTFPNAPLPATLQAPTAAPSASEARLQILQIF